MPVYAFVCSAGHVTEERHPIGERPPHTRCATDDCRRRARYNARASFPTGFIGNLRPEIPPHFNQSFNCHVESRAHLERLQKAHGCQDYSPSEHHKGPSTSWQ